MTMPQIRPNQAVSAPQPVTSPLIGGAINDYGTRIAVITGKVSQQVRSLTICFVRVLSSPISLAKYAVLARSVPSDSKSMIFTTEVLTQKSDSIRRFAARIHE